MPHVQSSLDSDQLSCHSSTTVPTGGDTGSVRSNGKRQEDDLSLGPLPPLWEKTYTPSGEVYFIDHNTGTSHWLDPRLARVRKRSLGECAEDELPYGWERVSDERYGSYYVDHIHRRTQYENPVLQTRLREKMSLENGGDGPEAGVAGGDLRGDKFTVTLTKGPQGLGFTLIGGADVEGSPEMEGYLQIRSIVPHGPAWIDGALRPGDVLMGVGGRGVRGASHASVAQLFQSIPPGCRVALLVCRGYPLTLDTEDPHTRVLSTLAVEAPADNIAMRHLTRALRTRFNLDAPDRADEGRDETDQSPPRPHSPAQRRMLSRSFDLDELGDPEPPAVAPPRCPSADHLLSIASDGVNGEDSLSGEPGQELVLTLRRGAAGFGFTIADSVHGQKVKKVLDRSRCAGLREGDLLLQIGDTDVRHAPHLRVVQVLKDCPALHETALRVWRRAAPPRAPRSRSATRPGPLSPGTSNGQMSRSKTPTAEQLRSPTLQTVDPLHNRLNGEPTYAVPEHKRESLMDRRRRSSTPGGRLSIPTVPPWTDNQATVSPWQRPDDHTGPSLSRPHPNPDRHQLNPGPHQRQMSPSPRTHGLQMTNRLEMSSDRLDINSDRLQMNQDRMQMNQDRMQMNQDRMQMNTDRIQMNPDRMQMNADRIQMNQDRMQMNPDRYHLEQDYRLNQDRMQMSADRLQLNADQLNQNHDRLTEPGNSWSETWLDNSSNVRNWAENSRKWEDNTPRSWDTSQPRWPGGGRSESWGEVGTPTVRVDADSYWRHNSQADSSDNGGFPEDGVMAAPHTAAVGGQAGEGARLRPLSPSNNSSHLRSHSPSNHSSSGRLLAHSPTARPPAAAAPRRQSPSCFTCHTGTNSPATQAGAGARTLPQLESTGIVDPEADVLVRLSPGAAGFGFRIVGGTEDGSRVAVGHVVPGGPADGLLRPGDLLTSADGVSLGGASHARAVAAVFQAAARGHLTLGVRHNRADIAPLTLANMAPTHPSPLGGEGQRYNLVHPSPLYPPQSHVHPHHVTHPYSSGAAPAVAAGAAGAGGGWYEGGGGAGAGPGEPYEVRVTRGEGEGFGFVVISSANKATSSIGQLIPNSPAAACGMLRVGDTILAINHASILHLPHPEVVALIKQSGRSVTLTVQPAD